MNKALTLFLALALGACESGTPAEATAPTGDIGAVVDAAPAPPAPDAEPEPEPEPAPDPDAAPPVEPNPVDREPGEPVEVIPERPPIEPAPPPARVRRRMNLDQLNAAIRQVSGGIGWTEGAAPNQRDLFVTLAATLGKPDYVQQTTEDLEASALFQKFLDDAARSVCDQMVTALDPLVRPGDDIDAHLAGLVQRFHGRAIPADAPEVVNWRWLYDSAEFVSDQPHAGARAICVALFTHPDFYSY